MDGNDKVKVGRRALLAAGAAGVAAAAAQAVAPASALAGSGNGANVQIGQVNDGTAATVVTTAGADGFRGQSDVGDGLVGESSGAAKSGLFAKNHHAEGYGVYGVNLPSGATGTLGSKGQGVMGKATNAEGVRGESNNNFGVVGASGGPGKAGVFGYASNKNGFGVQGRNTVSHTYGYLGGTATAVYGTSQGSQCWGALGGAGDHAGMSDPPGVYAFGLLGQATAMVVDGQAKFLTSGRMTIAAGKSSATVSKVSWGGGTVSLKLTPDCLVLATLQTNRAGLYVQAAVPNISKGTVTVYLNKKVTAATKVAWFVLNFGAP